MKKLIVVLGLVVGIFGFVVAPSVLAFEVPKEIKLEAPGMLPTSPFYFIEEFGRTIERFFTFNPVSKVKLELEIAEEKLAEIKKMSEINKGEVVIFKAKESYEDSLVRLKTGIENLKDTSRNSKVDSLLGYVVSRSLIHQEIFDGIKKENSKISDGFSGAYSAIDEVIAVVPLKDDPLKFSDRIEDTYNFLEGIDFIESVEASIKAVEVIDAIEEKVNSENLRDDLTGIKENFSEKAINKLSTDFYPGGELKEFFDYLKDQFQVSKKDVSKGYAKIVLALAEASVKNIENNIGEAVSRTDEEVKSILTGLKKLVREAKKEFDNKNYFKAWEKAQQVLEISGVIEIPSQALPLTESFNSGSPDFGSGLQIIDVPDLPFFEADAFDESGSGVYEIESIEAEPVEVRE